MEFIIKVLKAKIKSLKQDIKQYETKAKDDPEHEFIYTAWKHAKESELEYINFLLDIAKREEETLKYKQDKELDAEDVRVAGEIYDMAEESGAHELAKWIDTTYLGK